MEDTDFYGKDGPKNLTASFELAPADYIGDQLTGNGLIRKLQSLPPEVLALPVALYVSLSEDGDVMNKDAPIVVHVIFGPDKMLTITC